MKKNNGLLIGLSIAGAAIAATIVFLTTTKTKKKTLKKWGLTGKKLSPEKIDMVKDAKEKFTDLKQEYGTDLKEDRVTQAYE